jgi:alpha-amylase
MQIKTIALFFILVAKALQHHADEWKQRTIYQLLTARFAPTSKPYPDCPNLRHYCGGTFKGIQNNLKYIKGMGFDAIWISPIVKNTEWAGQTQGYHGYWMTDLYKLNEHFGTPEDLKALVKAAHDEDIWVMVDVVANHGGPIGFNYSKFGAPLNKAEHFHPYCNVFDIDHSENQWRMERCWLAGLADFNHENPFVYKTLVDWIGNMIKEYNIDGLRIDTVPHVPHHFWADFNKSSGVYQVGECLDPRTKYVATYQNYLEGKIPFKK